MSFRTMSGTLDDFYVRFTLEPFHYRDARYRNLRVPFTSKCFYYVRIEDENCKVRRMICEFSDRDQRIDMINKTPVVKDWNRSQEMKIKGTRDCFEVENEDHTITVYRRIFRSSPLELHGVPKDIYFIRHIHDNGINCHALMFDKGLTKKQIVEKTPQGMEPL